MAALFVILFSILFGICYHGRGGSFFSFKNGDAQYKLFGRDENGTLYFKYGGDLAARVLWWALPVTLMTYEMISLWTPALLTAVTLPAWMSFWTVTSPVLAIFVLYGILLWAAVAFIGHGAYQGLGTSPALTKSNFLTFWLPKYDVTTPYWKKFLIDFVGLAVTGAGRGLIQSLPLLVLGMKFLWLGPVGLSMALAYTIGYKLLNNVVKIQYFSGATDIGELLTGFFYGLGTALILLFA